MGAINECSKYEAPRLTYVGNARACLRGEGPCVDDCAARGVACVGLQLGSARRQLEDGLEGHERSPSRRR